MNATAPVLSPVRKDAVSGTMTLFRAFHTDLLAACAEPQVAAGPGVGPNGTAAERLVATLHAMSEAAASRGPAAHGTVVKAVFAMAMLADRALAQTRPADAVIAARLFGANATMQTLLVQADDLIRQGAKADRDLAAVYLAVLSLGFPEDAEASARRPPLHRAVAGERTETRLASPRAAEPAGGAVPGYARPEAKRWWWAVGGSVALFLLVSHLLWAGMVDTIQRDLRGARAAVEDMGLSWSY
ncbi:type VI protein secretion system component VasF [Azospirillum agricola]|uniref:DotU family type IV/VI secretion system protein n=1 Tax=Azospirillum agricola TaxID=1720247 RepID=UPI001AEA688E|nr:DotU family type IV/VI secretion system protein [Azospirillum agricola]MBP2227818.1 type VI protein secretion system component VasF [Azospirillum agricola]